MVFGIPYEFVICFMVFVLVFDIVVATYWETLVHILKAIFVKENR